MKERHWTRNSGGSDDEGDGHATEVGTKGIKDAAAVPENRFSETVENDIAKMADEARQEDDTEELPTSDYQLPKLGMRR